MSICNNMAKKKKQFIAITARDAMSDKDMVVRDTYEKAVDIIHNDFLDYDFELRNGRPYDYGHEDKNDPEAAYRVFDNVVIHNGKVASYSHCNGDGPIGEIRESE